MDRRKELKLAYKQNTRPSIGVFQIINKINGKILIGSSPNLSGRSNSYHALLEFRSYHDKALQADWKSHGPEAFTFEILETLNADEIPRENWSEALAVLEDKWLTKLQPYGDRGYNTNKKA